MDIDKKGYDICIKLLMVGDSSVGKTCLLLRYSNDTFSPTFITTIGIDFKIKYVDINNKRIKLQLWDTAGQERFRSITQAYFRGAHGAIITYDVTNITSFEHVKSWVEDLCSSHINKSAIFLVANKIDLENKRIVSKKQGEDLAKKHGLLYFECSAKTGFQVAEAFQTIADTVATKLLNMPVSNTGITIMPSTEKTIEKSKKCCN